MKNSGLIIQWLSAVLAELTLIVFKNTSDLVILGIISIIAVLVIAAPFFVTVKIMENKQF